VKVGDLVTYKTLDVDSDMQVWYRVIVLSPPNLSPERVGCEEVLDPLGLRAVPFGGVLYLRREDLRVATSREYPEVLMRMYE